MSRSELRRMGNKVYQGKDEQRGEEGHNGEEDDTLRNFLRAGSCSRHVKNISHPLDEWDAYSMNWGTRFGFLEGVRRG